jgi:hypothetical protein
MPIRRADAADAGKEEAHHLTDDAARRQQLAPSLSARWPLRQFPR